VLVLILKGYFQLLRFERYLWQRNFCTLYTAVRKEPQKARTAISSEELCTALDVACIWYWKPVLCLQRSAAATCLLRQYGFPAQMVLGAQQVPFRAHAWVELSGRVVNDKQYTPEMYSVLDRC